MIVSYFEKLGLNNGAITYVSESHGTSYSVYALHVH